MWWRRTGPRCVGAACFQAPAPTARVFDHLQAQGIEVRTASPSEGGKMRLRLSHHSWGRAELLYPVDPPSRELMEWDKRLTEEERTLARRAAWTAVIEHEPTKGDVLRDRKDLLRFLRAVMGTDGVIAYDATSNTFWPAAALDEELSHGAALDIEALFTLHLVGDEPQKPYWLHSHGLKEIGFSDFDVLNPHSDISWREADIFRAIALAIVEGRLVPDGGTFEVAQRLRLRLVPTQSFLSRSDPQAFSLWRMGLDESHTQGHAVVCEPAAGLMGRWRERAVPVRFFSAPMPDDILILFSSEATGLMAQRARETYPVLQRVASELAEFTLPVLVKLAYNVDGSSVDREHLWFEVHAFSDGQLDATLVNEPLRIQGMKAGTRGRHDVERLTDWTIITPFGPINPRWSVGLRQIRERPDEFRAIVAHAEPRG